MSIQVKTLIVELGVVLLIVCILGAAVSLVPLSQQTAVSNPELAHMRIPVLIMAWAILACAMAAIALSLLLLEGVRTAQAFTAQSVVYVRGMGLSALAATVPLITLIIYTQANVASSITNLHAGLGILMLLFTATFFSWAADLLRKAVASKQQH